MFRIFTDGGSRGNPGPAAIGIVLGNKNFSKFIGNATNNQAEYEAVVFALEQAKKLKAKNLEINLDSELVCRQLTGEYKIKDKKMQMLFIKAWNLMRDFEKVRFNYVPREENKKADKLVNLMLDKQLKI